MKNARLFPELFSAPVLDSRKALLRVAGYCLLVSWSWAGAGFAQSVISTPAGPAVRVTVTMNDDGSRTIFKFDAANRKATATTRDDAGKLRGKIRYTLDEAGHFATGRIFGPDGKMRFQAVYKYDASGKLLEESQLAKGGALLHKIVYAYDVTGRQMGFSIYDASGKLISQTTAPKIPEKGVQRKTR